MKKLLMMTLKLHKNLFKTAVASLDIHGNQYTVEKVENIVMLLIKQKKKVGFHPSILLIKKT